MGSESFKSNNMYQIYTYMNHVKTDKKVRWILLYPYNWENINEKYNTKLVSWKDAKFEFRTIDLSKDWRDIESDLLEII
jgi:5-methylcytosine-specific restriction endonuclease McrBC regulatory subunit McrC